MELKSSAKNIKLKNADEIFYTDEIREDLKKEKVEKLLITELFSFKDHPFKVLDDEKMMETVESVKENGVLVPIIVRVRKEGGYEIVSGHRRKRACELAGISEIPAIVKDLTDDEAVIIMVDSNLQRETVLPSEKAFAYKMRLEAMNRQTGRKAKENGSQVGNHLSQPKSSELLAEQMGESKNQIFRYIRLTNLIPDFLDMVDSKKMAFNPAVEVSFLDEKMQSELLDVIEMEQSTPSLSQAQKIKQFFQENKLDRNVLESIMQEEKGNQREHIKFKTSSLKEYFPENYTAFDIQQAIITMIKSQYKRRTQGINRPER